MHNYSTSKSYGSFLRVEVWERPIPDYGGKNKDSSSQSYYLLELWERPIPEYEGKNKESSSQSYKLSSPAARWRSISWIRSLIILMVFIFSSVAVSSAQQFTKVVKENSGLAGDIADRVYAKNGKVIVGTRKGLSISSNSGETWTNFTSEAPGWLGNVRVNDLFVDGNKVYAATGETNNFNGGLRVSDDGGMTWGTVYNSSTPNFGIKITDVISDSDVYSVFANGEIIAAGRENGHISLSQDGGVTWNSIRLEETFWVINSIYIVGNTIYAGSQGGKLYVSTNLGNTWTLLYDLETPIWYLWVQGNIIYVGTQNGLFISMDSGNQWADYFPGETIRHFLVNGSSIYSGSGLGIQISTDNGQTWQTLTKVANGLSTDYIQSVSKDGVDYYAASVSGLNISYGPKSPKISGFNLPISKEGALYSGSVSATPSTGVTFTAGGLLPSGLTLSSSGILSGTPSAGTAGLYHFSVTASDEVGSTIGHFTLTVAPSELYSLYGWGDNSQNLIGNSTVIGDPVTSPLVIDNEKQWVSVFSSDKSAYGIDADGKLYAWGDNSNGRLGTGNTSSVTVPTHVLSDKTFLQVATSAGGFTLALSKDGKLFAFGNNSDGQLGDGTQTSTTTPIEIISPNGEPWTAISVGRVHSMGLTSSGALYTWGSNDTGQIGDGGSAVYLRLEPVRIMPEKVWVKIQASELNSFAVDIDGKLYSWGSNSQGILGDGSSTDRSIPTDAIKINELNKNLAAGSAQLVPGYSQMVLVADGKLYTWGGNTSGELGNGTTTSSLTPLEIAIPEVKTGETWLRASAGDSFTHGLTSEGRLFGWGTNTKGNIGDGFKTVTSYDFYYNLVVDEDRERLTPVQIEKSFYWSKTSSHYYSGYSTFALGLEVISLPKELDITGRTGNTLVPTISNILSNKNVIWSSSNEDLATVDAGGNLTILGSCLEGVTITATTVEGGFSASTELVVTTCLLAGEGTSLAPYQIGTAPELTAIGSCGCALDATYQLTADIIMPTVVAGESNFTPIGTLDNPFTGVLDGNGKSVTGISIDLPSVDRVGMFTALAGSAVIKNLTLDNHFVRAKEFGGGLAGIIPSGNVLIESVQIKGEVKAGIGKVGGHVGAIRKSSGDTNEADSIEFKNVHFEGKVNSPGGLNGGLVGWYNPITEYRDKAYLKITGSSVKGEISSDKDRIGGLVGQFNGKGEISSSSFDGTVEGEDQLGGAVGLARFLKIETVQVKGTVIGHGSAFNIGGLIGEVESEVQIKDITLSGLTVEGNNRIGGLVGEFKGNTGGVVTSIENVEISNSKVGSAVGVNGNNIGGLIGSTNSIVVVKKAKVSSDVKVTGESSIRVGGVIGSIKSGATVSESVSEAEVVGKQFVGGFAGNISDEGSTEIASNYATGKVTGEEFVGGFVGGFGWEYSDTKGVLIKDSYSISQVNYGQAENFGGFVGGRNIITPEAGPWNNNSPVPYVVEFQILNSYYDKELNPEMKDEETYGKGTKAMQLIATYQDTEPAWNIDRADADVLGTAYPALRWTTEEENEAVWLIAKNIGDITIEEIVSQSYTGSEVKPELVVKDDTEELSEDLDYTVTYSDNVVLGTATVTVIGKGKYIGETTATFEIVENQLTIESQKLELSKEFDGTTSAKIEDIVLSGVVAGEEVSVSAVATYNNAALGTGKTITVVYTLGGKDKGNYLAPEDFMDKTAEITKKRLTVASQKLTESKTYDGLTSAVITDVVLAGFTEGEDVQASAVATYADEKAGTGKKITVAYTLEGEDADNYSAPLNFESTAGEITEKDLSELILGSEEETFSGSELKPSVTVKDGSETLVEGTDYEVTYSDNINVGTAKVTVNGIGNYSGTLTETFEIVSKSLEIAKIGTIGSQLYTGSELEPAVPVTDGSVTLVVGVDYSVSYTDNINVGTAKVTVTGIGNYKGTLDGNFQIVSKSIENAVIEAIVDQTYTGSELEPKVTLKDGSYILEEGVDYEVTYTDNIQTGKSTVTITGIGNYAGTVTTTFEIVSKSMEGAVIESIADQTFTGSELEPKLTVKDGSETLVEGTDYEVTYSDNINVGTATVTVNGIGNYSGTLTKTFNVVSKSLENAKIGTIGSQLYTGTERKPAVPVTDGSVTLVVGVDYSVSYADNINTGPATVTVTGIGNYKGTLDGNFQIVSKSIENAVVEAIVDQTYTGSELEPKVTLKDGSVTLEEGVDYEVTYTDNIQTGKSTVTIKGIGNYAGTVTTTFEIVSKSMEGAVIESIGDQTFTGSELEPKVTVKDGSETLVEGTDYEVTYSDNINVGTATVTVNGIGNYSGTLTKTFNVVSKSLEIAKIGTIGSQLYTGTERKPAVLVTDGSVTLVVGVDYTVSYTDNINVGTAKVTVTGIGNYKATLDGNFQIVSKSIENTVIEAIVDQTYTGSELEPKVTLKDGSVTLEEGVDYEVTYTDNIQTGKSTVTIKGIGNYAGTVTTTFEIVSKTLEDADIESIGNQTSTGSELEPKVTIKDGSVTLVEGTDYEVTYSDNISVGTATVTVKGIGNYSGTLMGSFKIVSKLLEGSTINAIADLTFAGVALEPALTVKDGTFTLVEGKDYTVSYSDNVNVGTVTVTLTGTGNYGGTLTSSFAILKKAVKITAEDKERNFGEANPMFTLLYEGVVVGATRIAVEPGISTEATATSIPGIYAIVLTGGSDPNYAITLVEGKLTVLNTSISEVRNLEGTVEDKEIGLSWELPEEYFGELSGYRIEISEDGENFKLLAETEALIYNATGLQNTQKYWFRVSAYSEFTVGKEKVIGPLIPLAVDTGENNTVETQEPGEYKFTIDGKEEEIFLDIVEDALVFESGPLKMQLEGNKATGEQLPILNGLLLLVPNGVAEVSGEGFKPNTAVAVWLVQNVDDAPGGRILEEEVYLKTTLTEINSVWKQSSRMMGAQKGEVYFLGYADVDENGRFKARLAIPQDIKPGRYTLQATGITGSGFSMTLNLGAILFEDVDLDTDGDLVPDIYEFIQGTDPNNIQEFQDINGDGVADYVEERSPIEVLKPGAVRSAWGAPINPANLPKQVAVFTGAKELVLLNVDWDYSKVNVDRRGSTIVSGELELKSGMFNGYNLKGSVEVVILPKPAPLDVALNNSVFKAEGMKFFIPVGGFQVNDPVDNIHEVTLQGSGYDNRFFEIKENILFWSSADRVAGKTAFSIMVRVTDRDGNTLDKVFDVQRIRPSMDELKIYNTFTPNGDRINDTWGVPEVRFYEGARIQVFERSGERVFYTEDPDERWDGSYKGKELPVGTYYWVLEIKETGHTRRGLLNLIRQ